MSAPHQPAIAGDPGAARALVLAGGGMRVAYQAGAVRALLEAGLRFAHADGASGGTINLAALMSGVDGDELCRRWRALPVRKFASLQPVAEYLHATRMSAFGDADGMIKHIYPGLGVDLDRIRAATGIQASFNVCRFDDKTLVPLPHTELDMPRLVAAASLPALARYTWILKRAAAYMLAMLMRLRPCSLDCLLVSSRYSLTHVKNAGSSWAGWLLASWAPSWVGWSGFLVSSVTGFPSL